VEARDISDAIAGSDGKPLTLVVARDSTLVVLPATSAKVSDGRYRLGFVLAGEGLPPNQALGESLGLTWRVTREIGASLGRLVTGEGRKDISSPVGIVQGSSDAAKQGTESFLFVLGLISLSIALLNLLPLLPLDGGHIVFAVAEGISGRAVRREIYERVSVVGIGLVLLLFVIGLTNDIGRLS
jgi:regulator of sigma E protease